MANNPLQGSDILINITGDSKIDLDIANWAIVVYPSDNIIDPLVINKSQATKLYTNKYKVIIPSTYTKGMKQGYQSIELKLQNGTNIDILKKSNAYILDVSASKNVEL